MAGANALMSASGEKVASVTELKTADGLRKARRQQGLSQVELADLLRISQSNISRWENGYDSIPHRISLILADILSGNRGRVHPFLRRLAEDDQRISILQAENSGFFADARWLHLGGNLARHFDIPSDESYMNLSSRFFKLEWRPKVFGSGSNDQLVAIEFEIGSHQVHQFGDPGIVSQHLGDEFLIQQRTAGADMIDFRGGLHHGCGSVAVRALHR